MQPDSIWIPGAFCGFSSACVWKGDYNLLLTTRLPPQRARKLLTMKLNVGDIKTRIHFCLHANTLICHASKTNKENWSNHRRTLYNWRKPYLLQDLVLSWYYFLILPLSLFFSFYHSFFFHTKSVVPILSCLFIRRFCHCVFSQILMSAVSIVEAVNMAASTLWGAMSVPVRLDTSFTGTRRIALVCDNSAP